MTFTKNLVAAALAGLTTFGFASVSLAAPSTAGLVEGSGDAHVALAGAVVRTGTTLEVNHARCGTSKGLNGFYHSQYRLLVVCQDNGVPGGPMVPWTPNDLDTLRHETQHLIQDCVVGKAGDGLRRSVYTSPSDLAEDVIGTEGVDRIANVYRANGADSEVIQLEHEAFAVATLNIPVNQIQDIKTYCGV